MNEAFVPTVVSLSAVLLSATVGLVLRYRCSAKPAPGATLLKEEATPAAPGAAELKETMVSLAEEGEGRRPRVTTREQRGDHPLLGSRVEFHGLQKAAPLNGSYGVVLRESAGRFAVRKEIAGADEAASVIVKASNLRAAPPLDSLAAVQRLVDAAPAGARVTLPRCEVPLRARAEPTAEPRRAVDVESDADAADQIEAETAEGGTQGGTLLLRRAITLAGMGCRSGGTVLHFGVEGELLELSGFHANGQIDISPWDLQQLRLTKLSVRAPPGAPAVHLDEIALSPRPAAEAPARLLMDECWVRGGSVGVLINAVGCTLRGCRVMHAVSYGVQANALFSIEGCTIGDCARSGRGAGIAARAGCTQLRRNGFNENRVQKDCNDREYLGYSPADCNGCLGRCTCAAMLAFAKAGDALVHWGQPGQGTWQPLCL